MPVETKNHSIRRPPFYWTAAFVLILLFVAMIFWWRAMTVTPPEARRADIPDYRGITVDHVLKKQIKAGKGVAIKKGDRVRLHFQMWVYDPSALGNHGPEILSPTGSEKEVIAGQQDLLPGWDAALIGMKPQEENLLIIPPEQAYGKKGEPGLVPGGAIIQISFTILSVRRNSSPQ